MQPSNAALFVVDRIARALVGVALAAALCERAGSRADPPHRRKQAGGIGAIAQAN